jgi:DNA end-binding protein Ku
MSKTLRPKIPQRPIWSGTITIGLVNVPVKLYTMIFDKSLSFRFLHKQDGQPLRYERVCVKEDRVVPWEDTVKGYEIRKGEFVVLEKEELKAARPESSRKIRIDKFVDHSAVDPIYFDRSYVLTPDKGGDEAYSLLLNALQILRRAAVGRITLRTKEYPVILHVYNGALVLTTLRYSYEIADPNDLEELKRLKEPNREELDLAVKIVNDLTGEFEISAYEDDYMERVRELIQKKMKGETITVEQPPKEEAKKLMVALQETLRQLKKT